jgi:hypothetical protein
VRYNAMLIIGDLDSRAAETQGGGTPADPWNESLPVLRDALVSDDQIDAVKVAALIGINRHAEMNRFRPAGRQMPEQAIGVLIKPVLELAQATQPPAGRTPEGHNWMRRQGVEILSHFAAARRIESVATAINSIVADPDEPLSLHCAAAEAQGRLLNPLAAGTTAEEQAAQLGRLATDCLAAELAGLQSFTDDLESKRDAAEGDGRGGGFGRDGGRPVDIFGGCAAVADDETPAPAIVASPIVATQRRLKHRLGCVSAGMFGGSGGPGLAAGVKDAAVKTQTQRVKEILDAVGEAIDAPPAGDPPDVDAAIGFLSSLDTQRAALRDLMPAKAPAKEPSAGRGDGPGTAPTDGPDTAQPPAAEADPVAAGPGAATP